MTRTDTAAVRKILPYLRALSDNALAKKVCQGVHMPADPREGRGEGCWLHACPPSKGVRPVVFEVHGGGFALGDARKNDAVCEWIRDRFNVHVVGVDYRLAPEHPYPAARNDLMATMSYFGAHAEEFRMDSQRFYLLGYSAGANLSVAACLLQRGDEPYRIKGCALHYPFLDAAAEPVEADSRAIDLPYEMMVAFNEWYVGGDDARNPLISPVFAETEALRALPRTVVYPVVGDPLKHAADIFYLRLKAAGVSCAEHPVEGMYHGYIEDAADLDVYRRTSIPETLAARPDNFVEEAARQMDASLTELLGPAANDVAYPSLSAEGVWRR